MYGLQQFTPDGRTFSGQFVPQQLMPPSLLGGLLGRRLSQSYGCGPSGSLGQRMPGFGWSPFDVDPVTAAYAYQQALAMQAML